MQVITLNLIYDGSLFTIERIKKQSLDFPLEIASKNKIFFNSSDFGIFEKDENDKIFYFLNTLSFNSLKLEIVDGALIESKKSFLYSLNIYENRFQLVLLDCSHVFFEGEKIKLNYFLFEKIETRRSDGNLLEDPAEEFLERYKERRKIFEEKYEEKIRKLLLK